MCACACMCVSACARVWLYVYTFSCMSVPSITMSVCANVGSGRCPTCSGVRVATFVYPVEVCVLCGYIWQLCMPCVAWVSQGTRTVGTPAYSLHKRLDVFGLSRVVWKGLCASGNGMWLQAAVFLGRGSGVLGSCRYPMMGFWSREGFLLLVPCCLPGALVEG